jgi:hypothetical protein
VRERSEGAVDHNHVLLSVQETGCGTEQLSADDRRGIIARYTAVIEGTFTYWMTAAVVLDIA